MSKPRYNLNKSDFLLQIKKKNMIPDKVTNRKIKLKRLLIL